MQSNTGHSGQCTNLINGRFQPPYERRHDVVRKVEVGQRGQKLWHARDCNQSHASLQSFQLPCLEQILGLVFVLSTNCCAHSHTVNWMHSPNSRTATFLNRHTQLSSESQEQINQIWRVTQLFWFPNSAESWGLQCCEIFWSQSVVIFSDNWPTFQ